jgi:hypothetical protein
MEERIQRLKSYLVGWRDYYYGFCETRFILRGLDSWVHHRLRSVQWKQWKVYLRRKAELVRLGVSPELAGTTAWSAKGPWRMSHTPGVRMALKIGYFDALGLPRLELRASN